MNELSQCLQNLERVREIASWSDDDKFMEAYFKFRYSDEKFKRHIDCYYWMMDEYQKEIGHERPKMSYDKFKRLLYQK